MIARPFPIGEFAFRVVTKDREERHHPQSTTEAQIVWKPKNIHIHRVRFESEMRPKSETDISNPNGVHFSQRFVL